MRKTGVRFPAGEHFYLSQFDIGEFYTVKPLKMATPRGMKKWPSYRGGLLMEVILLRILRVTIHLGNEKWPS